MSEIKSRSKQMSLFKPHGYAEVLAREIFKRAVEVCVKKKCNSNSVVYSAKLGEPISVLFHCHMMGY